MAAQAIKGAAKIAKCRLLYFDIKGKGEPIRLACAVAGLPLDDVRVKRDDFHTLRDQGKVPFSQLPVAEFFDEDDNLVCKIAQSRAILRLVARASGNKLYSADMAEVSERSWLDRPGPKSEPCQCVGRSSRLSSTRR